MQLYIYIYTSTPIHENGKEKKGFTVLQTSCKHTLALLTRHLPGHDEQMLC